METSNANQHDVFIGFSSEDIRYSFASHLSAAFRRSSISVFVGEDTKSKSAAVTSKIDFRLPDATQSANIEGTKFFVVVFSESYAFSPLFLETLVMFLERRKDGLVVVIPVFYGDVTPSIVEQQTENFGEAVSKDLLARWRDGLTEAANLRGHNSTDQRNDSELVEEIVADVREKMYPTGKIGFYSRFVGIENLLRKQSHDIYRLGLWGMAGIGKTTIAQAAFNLMSQDFEAHCFLEDFHVTFHEKGLYKLREEHSIENLKEKTVLVVLDDVRNPMDAESFLGGFDNFGLASLMLITSRDKQVLHQCKVHGFYEVTTLNKKEALQLFNHFAFPENEKSDSNLVEISNKVVEYASGNRTVLRCYGRELKGKTKPEDMEVEFERIKRYTPQEIINVFKSSYDTLNDHERNIFLDIACFFKDEQLDYILRILEGCGFFPHVGIDRLVDRSLLVISENKKVEMHNLVQDVGREIAKTRNSHISSRCRLWEPSSIKSLLEDKEPKVVLNHTIFNVLYTGPALGQAQ
uniref:Putative WRKY transcription factor 16 n=1 Tax=Noccaea caerulescens TaxID=107243 RepID=A0A1J3IPB2_NOCCA